MNTTFFNGIRAMLNASRKAEAGLHQGAEKMLKGIEQRRAEFENKKKELENDIKRGSKLSKGRLPL